MQKIVFLLEVRASSVSYVEANFAKASALALAFFDHGICLIMKSLNCVRLALAFSKYFAILLSFAWNSSVI